jgi:hypothetical protein
MVFAHGGAMLSETWGFQMSSGIESAIGRALGRTGGYLAKAAGEKRRKDRVRRDSRAVVPVRVAERLLDELSDEQTAALRRYLESPDFEEIALHLTLGQLVSGTGWDKVVAEVREELRHGLRHSADFPPDSLLRTTDAVLDALTIAVTEMRLDARHVDAATFSAAAHLAATAASNGRLLARVSQLTEFHDFAARMRVQVAALQGEMRLPHLGVNRSVPYEQLYVEPPIRAERDDEPEPSIPEIIEPGRRTVILGSPGAGKSTLAAKLAFEIATDRHDLVRGKVPFLLVFRNFVSAFQRGERGLVEYLEGICREPYNVEPPTDAVEYLLRNGRAVVILDGLDELVDTALRHRVVRLVEGFVHHYPLVPVIVTARKVGYSEAPLSEHLFRVGFLDGFTEDQTESYVHRWFELDDSTSAPERENLATSFMRESASVSDLRSNPLLLALLCAMYSAEHYIPHNRAQVYERCATMLFDRWDSMRGIDSPIRFQGWLRGAVQHLAWRQFTSMSSGEALPHDAILRILAKYLENTKGLDGDKAREMATEFTDFCTGRAWILTDIGATCTEPSYGFTHRTFMEYFAAEHLVRTNPSPEALWHALKFRVLAGQWDVVGQIALQLIERNIEGGADHVLSLVLAEKANDLKQRSALARLAARALSHVFPSPGLVESVIEVAVALATAPETSKRFGYWFDSGTRRLIELSDLPLGMAVTASSPGIRTLVADGLVAALGRRIEAGNNLAIYLAHRLMSNKGVERKYGLDRLGNSYPSQVAHWEDSTPWSILNSANSYNYARLVQRFGVESLYLCQIDGLCLRALDLGARETFSVHLSPVYGLTFDLGKTSRFDSVEECRRLLVSAPVPWVPAGSPLMENSSRIDMPFSVQPPAGGRLIFEPVGSFAIIFLPYLELGLRNERVVQMLTQFHPLLGVLINGRQKPTSRGVALRELGRVGAPRETEEFLAAWVRGEFSVIG